MSNDTETLTLTDFLLARIAEDEAAAQAAATIPGAESWHWVDSETDEPITGPQYADVIAGSLRSVENVRPSESFGRLPVFLTSAGGSPEIKWEAAAHIARHDPARVLAECEAKRRIVERADNAVPAFAAIYVDHPDFRDEWGRLEMAEEQGTRFRVEVACDGYASLTAADVPSGVVSDEDYLQGARDAAEAIRDALRSRP